MNIDNKELVFGLDIGTRSIVGTVGYKKGEDFIVVSQEVIEHTTRSMIDGQIHDIPKVGETVLKVKEKLEKNLKCELEDVCIAAAGRVLKTITTSVDLNYEYDTVISQEDIYSVESLGVEKAYEEFAKQNTDTVQFFCVGYSIIKYYINDLPIVNLIGHKGKKITIELIATFLPNDVVDGLTKAVEIADLNVANLTLEPIAAMHVAIPDRYRMLNIALVDVGAGTSDICITKSGSIVAYGMIPIAGDLLTEKIVEHCLVDFQTAEQIKRDATNLDVIKYEDILLLPQTITKEELNTLVETDIDTMTKQVANKIIELNGGKSVSAVFVIGGGGKFKGYTQKLSEALGIPAERVAIRGSEVMQNITFMQDDIIKDSMLVTPVGICLSYYEKGNNFIHILLNDKKIKVYNTGDMSVVDGIMQAGIANEDIFPKKGDSIHYTVDGINKTERGSMGESAIITVNGAVADLNTPMKSGDCIKLIPSTKGEDAKLFISKLEGSKLKLDIYVNDNMYNLPACISVNGELKSDNYQIKDGDAIEFKKYYKLEQLLDYLDRASDRAKKIYVNNEIADMDTLVYDNFKVVITNEINTTLEDELDKEVIELDNATYDREVLEESGISKGGNRTIYVNINGMAYALSTKTNYVYVDIFDVFKFDMTVQQDKRLVTNLNGRPAGYLETINDGDFIEVAWKDL